MEQCSYTGNYDVEKRLSYVFLRFSEHWLYKYSASKILCIYLTLYLITLKSVL